MRIAVTGGAGFIGSHIVDAYIADGHDVVVIDNFSTGKREFVNPRATLVEADIRDSGIQQIFEEWSFDVVSHHAAQIDVRSSVADPRFDADVNVVGSLNLFEAARKSGVEKIIFASSGGTVYGDVEQLPTPEDVQKFPVSPYGIAKLSIEYYLYFYYKEYGIDYVALRYGNVFGPRQNPKGEAGVIAIFVDRMLSGAVPTINGDGLQTRDYVYIDDVVVANRLALSEEALGAYNVANGIETNVVEIFKVVRSACGLDIAEHYGPAKGGEQRRVCCDFTKYQRALGWSPTVSLDQGIGKVVEYERTLRSRS